MFSAVLQLLVAKKVSVSSIQKFRNSSMMKVFFCCLSKIKRVLGDTSFSWAFSISTMLRQSLKLFLKSLPISSIIQLALQKVEGNEFHKRLRNELIMLPIPKAKFNARKVPKGVDPADFEDEMIEKQNHVLQSAISRVSSTGKQSQPETS